MDNGFPFHSKENYYFEHHHKVRLDWLIDKHFGSKNLQHVEIVLLSKHARKYNLKKMAIMGLSSSFEFIGVFLPNLLQCGACKKFRVLI
jgi:hypothetical protein